MPDFTYIENYFKGDLNPQENGEFEQQIKNDPVFADEVAFYCSAIHVIKSQAAEEKKIRFRKLYDESKLQQATIKPAGIKKLWPYIAAAAVITGIVAGLYMYFKPLPLQQQADQFFNQRFPVTMGVTMSGNMNVLDSAYHLYNEGKFPEALQLFEKINRSESNSVNAKEMAGAVSLRLGQYDKAIEYFTQLENLPRLYSNPGKLYHALALIKRNRPGDNIVAKQLLQQVIDRNLEDKETAKKWTELL